MDTEIRSECVRVTQSPMNPKRWCLDLACHHESWVTAGRIPKKVGKRVKCQICTLNAIQARQGGSHGN